MNEDTETKDDAKPINYLDPNVTAEEFNAAWVRFGYPTPAPLMTPAELEAELEAKRSGVYVLSDKDFDQLWKEWGVKRKSRAK